MTIFLSYAREEQRLASTLDAALSNQGHEVFFDRADLSPVHAVDARIGETIDGARE